VATCVAGGTMVGRRRPGAAAGAGRGRAGRGGPTGPRAEVDATPASATTARGEPETIP
jgi:hypothetical protein